MLPASTSCDNIAPTRRCEGETPLELISLIAIVLAIIALRRSSATRALQERIAKLELQLSILRPQVHREPSSLSEPTAPPARSLAATPLAVPTPAVIQPLPQAAEIGEPPPRSPSASPPVSPPPTLQIDWEWWIGVRGAAVLGGVVLALAALFFFRYSVEHGLIPPWLRVVLGTLVGVASLVAAEWRLREKYAVTANALAGGGVVVLYAAFWAAGVLYHLVATPVAFALMISVTVVACLLAWRHASLVVALIGLIGGFVTPFLLSSGADRPIGLFAYILLLDVGLLYLAQRREWPLLALLSVVVTAAYETLWILARMGPERLPLGLEILGIFALVFAIATRAAPDGERRLWVMSQAGGVLFPFAFALYFAGGAQFGPHLYPVAFLLLPLSAAAGWIARVQARPMLAAGSAAAVVGVVTVWLFTRQLDLALTWELTTLAVLFGLVFHAFVEWDPDRPGSSGPAQAAIVAALGLLGLLVVAATRTLHATPWPLLAGWLGLSGLLVRHAAFAERGFLQAIAAGVTAVGLSIFHLLHIGAPSFPATPVYLATVVAVGVLFQAVAVRRAASAWAERAAALFALIVVPPLSSPDMTSASAPWLLLLTELLLGFFAALVAARLGSGRWLLAAMLVTALGHSGWTWVRADLSHDGAAALIGLAVELSAVVLFTAWPFIAFARLHADRWAWYAAALAPPAWFLALRSIWLAHFGPAWIGALPVLLAVVALAAAARTRQMWPGATPERQRALVWMLAVALAFITAAIPLQLAKEWITIGWALEAVALTMLWQRFDHPGLKYVALALVAGVTIRLLANPAVLGYYPRPAWRIVNWLMYTYLVPAAALLTVANTLNTDEVARARHWEEPLYATGNPVAALTAGLAGLVLIFLWINLAIADWFATGASLHVSFERLPARDLATSIAWAGYALMLLALGVHRSSRGLRWVSLGLMMVTIGKVFLYDLGELRDLYRVASLLGLAVSLIVVSLAYQRFVLRKTPAEEP